VPFEFAFFLILFLAANMNTVSSSTDPATPPNSFKALEVNKKMHQRTPSQIEISQFKALTKLDAFQTLQKELSKLLITAPPNEIDSIRPEFAGFERLFKRYLSDENTEIK